MTTTAIRDGDHYVVNGSKTFITNGINADLVITAVKTDPSQRHKGMSLLVLERGMEGFERGRNLEKVGLHAQDTAELFFTDVRVPVANLLGDEGEGFRPPRHEPAPGAAVDRRHRRRRRAGRARAGRSTYVQGAHRRSASRSARSRTAGSCWPRCATEIEIAPGVRRPLRRSRSTPASSPPRRRRWRSGGAPSCRSRVVDPCVQLHGGYGYMIEYPIARAYADARITTIYGGTTEIMKEIIGRSLGL